MTSLTFRGTAQGLQDFLHAKTMNLIGSEEYLNDPKRFEKLSEVEQLEKEKEMYDQEAFESFTDH